MGSATNAERRVGAYLDSVRAGLRELPEAQAAEIVEELRSHIQERAERSGALSDEALAAALERLGPPAELAALYVAEKAVPRPERHATPKRAAILALLASLGGYMLAAAFGISALMKPFAPDRAGLWRLEPDTFSLRLGFGAPPGGLDALGWWIVPVGLGVGTLLFLLSTRLGSWSLRRLRP